LPDPEKIEKSLQTFIKRNWLNWRTKYYGSNWNPQKRIAHKNLGLGLRYFRSGDRETISTLLLN
jgi:hypothetical protein